MFRFYQAKIKVNNIFTFNWILCINYLQFNLFKNRYLTNYIHDAFSEKDYDFFEKNIYIKLYKSGFEVFKNSPILGVGNKNYRVETCSDKAKKFKIIIV